MLPHAHPPRTSHGHLPTADSSPVAARRRCPFDAPPAGRPRPRRPARQAARGRPGRRSRASRRLDPEAVPLARRRRRRRPGRRPPPLGRAAAGPARRHRGRGACRHPHRARAVGGPRRAPRRDPVHRLRGRHHPPRRAVLEPARLLPRRPDRRARRRVHQLRPARHPAARGLARAARGGGERRIAPRPARRLLVRREALPLRGGRGVLARGWPRRVPPSVSARAVPAAVRPQHAGGTATRPLVRAGMAGRQSGSALPRRSGG